VRWGFSFVDEVSLCHQVGPIFAWHPFSVYERADETYVQKDGSFRIVRSPRCNARRMQRRRSRQFRTKHTESGRAR
jgi:hypothetical protein